MKFRLKQLVAAMLAGAISVSCVFAENLGLKKANIISTAIAGVQESTPADNSFMYEGKKYILLDTEEKDGEAVFFVMSEECMGVKEIDADNHGKFDISDTNNIAYWLNNEFLTSGNLPEGIINNIDYNHEWHTEPTNLEGFTEEYVTEAGVALMSLYEYEKYIEKFATVAPEGKVVAWWLRTARAAGTTSSKYQLAVPFSKPGTVTRAEADTESLHVRPVFFLTEDFFAECKLSEIGGSVLKAIDENMTSEELSGVYSEEELKEYFKSPRVYDINFEGENQVGGEVSISYEYEGNFLENESIITWVWDDAYDGEFSNEFYYGNEKSTVIPENLAGKYIKVKITPMAEKGVLNKGEEVLSEEVFGPVMTNEEALEELKNELPGKITSAELSEKVQILIENKDLFYIDSDDEYRLNLTGLMLAGKEFSDFSELAECVKESYNNVKKAILDGEPLEGLTKQNRIGQTTPLDGAVSDTPQENIFRYKNYDFVVLDKIEKNGKTYFYVITKDYFGSQMFDFSGQNRHFYDVYDKDSIGNWLNTEFLFSGNNGKNLPEEMISHMDVAHVWHTEPTNYEGYTKETLSVGPISLISNTEWCKYVKKLGNDTTVSDNVYWFRTARAGAVTGTNTVLTSCPAVAGTTLEKNASLSYAVRPVFYLSEDFFREYKCDKIGENVSGELDLVLLKDEVENLYSDSEIKEFFKGPKLTDVTVLGLKLVGEELYAEYKYSSFSKEKEIKYRWQVADSAKGSFSDIPGGDNDTLKVTSDLKGKFIRVGLTPVSEANINSVGDEVFSESFGAIYSESDILAKVNGAEKENIKGVLEEYNQVLCIDLTLGNISDEAKDKIFENISDTDFSKISELKTCIGEWILVARVNEAQKEEILDIISKDEYGFDAERLEMIESVENIAEAVFGKNFENYETLKKTYFEVLCMEEMKNADRTVIKDILIYYDEYLKEDIGSFDEEKLKSVGTVVLKEDYESFAEFDKAVSDASDKADDKDKKPSYTGGGSGGGSSSKKNTNMTPNFITPENVQKAPDVFSDLNNVMWAKDKIEELAVKGIIKGVSEEIFAPNELMTREQFVTLIVRAFGFDDAQKTVEFSDVSGDMWYSDSIYRAYNAGVVKGIDESNFGVGQNITREQLVTILYRAVKEKSTFDITTALTFGDSDSISDYAKEAVTAFCNGKIVNGYNDNTFKPQANATRAECAVIIHRILNSVWEG